MRYETQTYRAEGVALDALADVLNHVAARPMIVRRFGVIQDGGTDPGTGLVLQLDKRPAAGSDTNRAQQDTLQPTAAIGQGSGVYRDLTSRVEVDVGEELVLAVGTAGSAGATGTVFLEVDELPFSGTRATTNMTGQ